MVTGDRLPLPIIMSRSPSMPQESLEDLGTEVPVAKEMAIGSQSRTFHSEVTGRKGFWNEGTRKETHTPREGTIHRGVHPEKKYPGKVFTRGVGCTVFRQRVVPRKSLYLTREGVYPRKVLEPLTRGEVEALVFP